MQAKKSQETQKLLVNNVTLFGRLTQKGDLGISSKGNRCIKFVLSNTAFCICAKEYAEMVNILDIGTKLLVEGQIVRIKDRNIIYASVVESYTTQSKIDVKKLKKELKLEDYEF